MPKFGRSIVLGGKCDTLKQFESLSKRLGPFRRFDLTLTHPHTLPSGCYWIINARRYSPQLIGRRSPSYRMLPGPRARPKPTSPSKYKLYIGQSVANLINILRS